MAIAHFAVGAAATTLAVTAFLPDVAYQRTLVLLGGVWAMVPDVHWVSPVAGESLHALHDTSLLTDLFWFHRALDGLDPTNSRAVAAALVGVFLAATAAAEWRGYRRPAVVRDALDGPNREESS